MYFSFSGNFNQLVYLMRRHNSNFNQWFCDSSFRTHQVRPLVLTTRFYFDTLLGFPVFYR